MLYYYYSDVTCILVYLAYDINRYLGIRIRCVYKKTTITKISYSCDSVFDLNSLELITQIKTCAEIDTEKILDYCWICAVETK